MDCVRFEQGQDPRHGGQELISSEGGPTPAGNVIDMIGNTPMPELGKFGAGRRGLFVRYPISVVEDEGRFLGLITRIDLLHYLRRRQK